MARPILCPVDGSEASRNAVDCAIDLARLVEAPLAFLAIEIVPADRFPRPPFWNRQHLAAAALDLYPPLQDAARRARARGVQFHCCMANASYVGRAVVAYAESIDCNHIVIGADTTRGWQYIFFGSVAIHVAQHARCPVTVAH